ncbi:TlpA family protein disulfide reductase [Shewanella intestini]|uniref:TlpA family protein disulfide reductase n=1 Tax=Shewanella intestini TaxID=2017544 RepID=A0ABS5I5B8_9GAMM|nr:MULTISPECIES: TlpA disulfide reductase family protein [Shewanella]MBR9729111.1 TlpA family protein disulfide reductase [Shewanella intestini]MRG37187.1 thioredoxin fold domain-containing protein [Shewanella sp. XMDDZSB0408]
MLALKAHFKRGLLLATLVVSSQLSAQSHTNAMSVENITLKNLRTSELSVAYQDNKPTVLMIFQPGCPWCKKQGHIIEKLQQACGDKIHFNLVGDNGSKQQLKRELRHFSKQLESLQSSNLFIRQSGGVKGYPTTLVIDNQGHIVAKHRGFTSQKLLRRLTNELSHGECTI